MLHAAEYVKCFTIHGNNSTQFSMLAFLKWTINLIASCITDDLKHDFLNWPISPTPTVSKASQILQERFNPDILFDFPLTLPNHVPRDQCKQKKNCISFWYPWKFLFSPQKFEKNRKKRKKWCLPLTSHVEEDNFD